MLPVVTGWVAPIATTIAAMMTAANLGARVTGWGFVLFTLGSLCWIAVGAGTGQANLMATNGFLTLVNLVGIWRWLGRQRRYEDGGKAAKAASRRSPGPALFTATGLAGMPLVTHDGDSLGKAVEALLACGSGTISYVVVATASAGGIAETLRAVPREALAFQSDRIMLTVARGKFDALVPLTPDDWPATAEWGGQQRTGPVGPVTH